MRLPKKLSRPRIQKTCTSMVQLVHRTAQPAHQGQAPNDPEMINSHRATHCRGHSHNSRTMTSSITHPMTQLVQRPGASATPNALAQMMDAAAGATIPALSAAAKKKRDTAASKAAKAEQRKATAARKKATPPQPGAAGAASQPTTPQEGTAIPPELPPITEEIPEVQHLPPVKRRSRGLSASGQRE